MKRPTFAVIARIYVVTLGILSFWFMARMAFVEPLCTGCSINLVKWALPRAEILTVGWLIAGAGTAWRYRHVIERKLSLRFFPVPRKAIAATRNHAED